MTKDVFAKSLDYLSYDTLKSESTLILRHNDYYHYVVESSNGFVIWVDTPHYCRNVATFKSFEEARNYILGTPKHHRRFRDLFHHRIGLSEVTRQLI